METTIIKNKVVAAMFLAVAGKIVLMAAGPRDDLARADVNPKVIEITAKKFEFTPREITIKKGEPVILRVTSLDRVHGFMSKPLKFDTDIVAGKNTDIAVTPDTAGDFTVICDHYCGSGHGGMNMKISVVN
jgi:cytochrome c oxidase subunit II